MDDKTFTSIPQPSSTAFDLRRSPVVTKLFFPNPSTSTFRPSNTSIKPTPFASIRILNMDKNQSSLKNSLMSPPEALPLESFAQSNAGFAMDSKLRKATSGSGATFPISPPVSPETKNRSPEELVGSQAIADPILYPISEHQSTAGNQPSLFENDESLVTNRVVAGHVAARKASMFREASPPRRDDYELALEFKSQVVKLMSKDPALWLRRERIYLKEDRELQSGGARRWTNIAPAVGRSTRVIGTNATRVTKTVRHPRPVQAPRSGVRVPSGTPGPDVKRVAREDKDFEGLPDYCPPITSLPNKPNSLKVDWKGAPIDLRNDPNVHLLHPDEVSLAANLRLDCATYLTSKRRIFIKRIEALKVGKEFRKTDAQQACKIDVNKASKLWQAFDKVGWLNPSWVKKFA